MRWDAKSIFLKGLGAISTIAKYTLLSYIALYFAMVENGAQSSSRRWIWHPISLYDTILYSIDVYYPIIYCAMVEMAPNPFQEANLASHSQYMMLYLDTQLTYTIL